MWVGAGIYCSWSKIQQQLNVSVWISSHVIGSNYAAVTSSESLQAATSAQYFTQIPGKVTLVTLGNTQAVTTGTLEEQKNTLIA